MSTNPSVVISTRENHSSVYVDGVCKLFRGTEAEAYAYAQTMNEGAA